jgi:hypothetical protein
VYPHLEGLKETAKGYFGVLGEKRTVLLQRRRDVFPVRYELNLCMLCRFQALDEATCMSRREHVLCRIEETSQMTLLRKPTAIEPRDRASEASSERLERSQSCKAVKYCPESRWTGNQWPVC